MSELATLTLADAGDAREIAEMSRDLVEQGLTWSWIPARVNHFICGADSSVVVARLGGAPRVGARHSNSLRGNAQRIEARRGEARHIAAFAIMHFGDEVAHLNLLAVAPQHRRQGLGRQLMEWLTTTAIEAGVFRIDLELRTQNGQARAFYESLGYAELDVVQGYYQGREAALRMSRRLGFTP